MIKSITTAALTLLALAVADCAGGSEPDLAACKQALRVQIDADQPMHGSQMWKRPAACDGVNDQTIQVMSAEAFQEKMREDIEKAATPTSAAPTTDVAACRAAMKIDIEVGFPAGREFPPSAYKPVCTGVDRTTLRRLVNEIVDEAMDGGTTS